MSIHIQELVVFPIKSLRGINVPSAMVEKRGLRHDRRWMVVDEEGTFLTQRKLHKMALFDTAFTDAGLRVEVHGMRALEVPFEPTGARRTVQVWQSVCEAVDVGEEASAWFSEALGQRCSLVYMPETTKRRVPSSEAKSSDIVGFGDSNPILVASQASIEDLNDKLEEPIPIRRFRANIVLSGPGAFEEDDWAGIQLGEVNLRRVKRCARCAMPTIDIETAIPSQEPLRTLNTYRKFDGKVCFGTFYAPDSLGEITVGAEVIASP